LRRQCEREATRATKFGEKKILTYQSSLRSPLSQSEMPRFRTYFDGLYGFIFVTGRMRNKNVSGWLHTRTFQCFEFFATLICDFFRSRVACARVATRAIVNARWRRDSFSEKMQVNIRL
jgi:hypothetical protein